MYLNKIVVCLYQIVFSTVTKIILLRNCYVLILKHAIKFIIKRANYTLNPLGYKIVKYNLQFCSSVLYIFGYYIQSFSIISFPTYNSKQINFTH